MPDTPDLDEDTLRRLVASFYERVRADAALGPIFNDAIHDWPAHLETLTAFWSSVMLTSGRYKGNPMAAHLKHQARITPALFERWLALWGETTAERLPPDSAAAMQEKAARIARSLQYALSPLPLPGAA
jgi:hemoglobin